MLYDTEKMAEFFATKVHEKMYYNDFRDVSITLYDGTQPNASEWRNDYTTNYFWNSDNTAGSQALCRFKVVSLLRTDNEIYLSASSSHSTTTIRPGTATWAVIAPNAETDGGDTGGLSSSGDHYDWTNSAMIVPVSDVFGNGVVKLQSTTVSVDTEPQLAGAGIVFGMGAV